MDIKKDFITRVGIIYVLVFVFGMSVVAKIVHIQFFDEQIKERTTIAKKTEKRTPKRGDIYSRNGKVLACSVPEYVVYFDYRIEAFKKSDTLFTKFADDLAEGLATLFAHEGKTKQQYLRELHKTVKEKGYLRLHKRPISYTMLQKVKELPILKYGAFKGGLLVNTFNSRVYPFGDMTRRTIGLIRKGTFHGSTGVELAYDSYLYGKDGSDIFDNDPRLNSDNSTVDGYDIITTIDTEIQAIANEELLKGLTEYKGTWGCVIVMEVQTGEILAIANLQQKENSKDTAYYELENRAVDYKCDPGSTIKLPSILIALEDGVVDLDDTLDTGNGLTSYYGMEVVDWNHKTQGGFHRLSVKDIFANSSNVGVTKIIYNNYVATKKQWDYVERLQSMGFNKVTGIDLNNETKPLVKDPSMTTKTDKNQWYKTTLISMAYGYEIELTPLQILNYYNAVANNGVMVRPHLVKEIRSETQVIKKIEPVITNNAICSEQTLKKAHIILEAVVETGTAKGIKNKYYKIAGKTGTAQTIVNNRYDDKLLRGSFAGYFPAEKPKYSMIIVMQSSLPYDPYKISGTNAAKIFKRISDRIFFNDHELRNQIESDTSNFMVLPQVYNGYTEDFKIALNFLQIPTENAPASAWAQTSNYDVKIKWKPLLIDKKAVPDFYGMGLRDALYLAENNGLRVTVKGFGKVYRQSVTRGAPLKKGETIVLELR